MLFEQYRMALKRDSYDIEVRNDDAINRNQIFFDFIQWTFNRLDGLYMYEKCLLIDTIKRYQLRKQSAVEVDRPNRENPHDINRKNEGKFNP